MDISQQEKDKIVEIFSIIEKKHIIFVSQLKDELKIKEDMLLLHLSFLEEKGFIREDVQSQWYTLKTKEELEKFLDKF